MGKTWKDRKDQDIADAYTKAVLNRHHHRGNIIVSKRRLIKPFTADDVQAIRRHDDDKAVQS